MARKKPKQNILRKSLHGLYRVAMPHNFLGYMVGFLFVWLSFLPSLMPRPWLLQGLICGLSFVFGYIIGWLASYSYRWMELKELSASLKNKIFFAVRIIVPIITLLMLLAGHEWQNEVRSLVGVETDEDVSVFGVILAALIVIMICFSIVRLVQGAQRFINRKIGGYLPKRMGAVISVLVTVFLVYSISTDVLFNSAVSFSDTVFARNNTITPEGIQRPTVPERSGSEASVISWEDLGREGRKFIGTGPTTDQIAAFIGEKAKQPIRIYSGVTSADTPEARAELIVQELQRTKAFDREVVVIATPTGSGWIEEEAPESLEYMYGGDTAFVAQQYSYLPSWLSFILDKQDSQNTGRALFDAVYGEWVKLPIDKRPTLLVYGLSLGAFGGQSAFSGINDVRNSTDGALFQGTPNDTSLWRSVTDQREAGTPEWQPIFNDGRSVQFASTDADVDRAAGDKNWKPTKILYMQHASDPVVWFSFNLLNSEPDWMREAPGPDVTDNIVWVPFVSFGMLAIDQMIGNSVPVGHGHLYADTLVDSWGTIAPPPGWNQAKANRLNQIIFE